MPIVVVGSPVTPTPDAPVTRTPAVLQFTSGIGGDVRLDLNPSGAVFVAHDSLDFGAPSLDGDPGAVGGDYGQRTLTVEVIIRRTAPGAMAFIASLSREVQRRRNWLKVQLEPTMAPVWFSTYRSAPGALSLSEIRVTNSNVAAGWWSTTLTLTADTAPRGEKVTLAATQIANDPATGACRWTLPAIKGDFVTPITVQVTPSVPWTEYRPLLSLVRHGGSTPPDPVVWQTNSFTVGANVAHATGDAAFSAGSKTTVGFVGASAMVPVLSGSAPTTPAAGRYRVLLRMARSDQESRFAVQLLQNVNVVASASGAPAQYEGNGVVAQFGRAASSPQFATLVDLGEFAFPLNSDGWQTGDLPAPSAPRITLTMARTSGTGSAILDYFVLIPVDTATTSESRTLLPLMRGVEMPSSRTAVFDGEAERFRAVDTATGTQPQVRTPEAAGQYLVVDPAGSNVLHLHHQVDAITPEGNYVDNPDILTATAQLVVSYYPRYLFTVTAA